MWPEVLEAVIGRRIAGEEATVMGYDRLRVVGQHYPVVVPSLEDSVVGVRYRGLTAADFQRLDAFEGEEYDRAEVAVGGERAYLYVLSDGWQHIADSVRWHPEDLRPEHLAAFRNDYKCW